MDLRNKLVQELHRPARKNFPRRNVEIKGLNDLYQADLVEMIPHSKSNKGYKYILTVIDCFSKTATCIPLKNKSSSEVSTAMESILKKNKMKHLQTDDGREFFNRQFSDLMLKYNINHYSTKSEKKASIIERFNRTLKTMMYKRFSERGTYIWWDILTDIVVEYNHKKHRTIGMRPVDVKKDNAKEVLARLKKNTKPISDKRPSKKFTIGDQVRISKYKQTFTKGYLPNWTNEVFTVHDLRQTTPETYTLKDLKGEILDGTFYGHELSKSTVGNVYLVEKVLRTKGDKVLVRWLGFDRREDSWIPKKDLV